MGDISDNPPPKIGWAYTRVSHGSDPTFIQIFPRFAPPELFALFDEKPYAKDEKYFRRNNVGNVKKHMKILI